MKLHLQISKVYLPIRLIDSHSGLRGYIFWCDVLDIFLILMQEKTSQPAKQPLRHDGKYKYDSKLVINKKFNYN